MVGEQRRVQEMRLAEEYNKSLYFNRKLGEVEQGRGAEGQGSGGAGGQRGNGSSQPMNFYRAYGDGNGQADPTTPPLPHSPTPPLPTSYAGQPSSTTLTPELVSQVNQILQQGQRLGIEFVDDRRFRTNSWNCYGTFQNDGAAAIAALEACLAEHQHDYVRLVGVAGSDRRRVVETIVHRPIDKAPHSLVRPKL